MASPVDIVNLGLAHIGAEAQVAAIDPPDGSVEAGYGARFYPHVRRLAIDRAGMAFSLKRVALAEITNVSTVWLYAYALPADCINPIRVLQLQYISAASLLAPLESLYVMQQNLLTVDNLFTERGSADFEVEGSTLFTNEPEAVLKYTADITDTGKFPPLFVDALGMLMAGYLAGPIIKGTDGMQVGAKWREAGFAQLARAADSDANAASERAEHVAESVRARL